jgi:hypothetical protein
MDTNKERLLHFTIFICFCLVVWCYKLNEENAKAKDLLFEAEKTIINQSNIIQNQTSYINMMHKITSLR